MDYQILGLAVVRPLLLLVVLLLLPPKSPLLGLNQNSRLIGRLTSILLGRGLLKESVCWVAPKLHVFNQNVFMSLMLPHGT